MRIERHPAYASRIYRSIVNLVSLKILKTWRTSSKPPCSSGDSVVEGEVGVGGKGVVEMSASVVGGFSRKRDT